jgi:glycine/D-amino acid oxidase-like deaminating enzyme
VLRGGGVVTGDAVVVAAGGWTPALLRASGHPTALRTKHIQYALLRTGPVPLPSFVDGTTGLWGRPTDDGRLLVGLPSQRWDVDPSRPPPDAALAAEVRRVAQDRLGRLAAVPLDEVVSAADCYHDPPGLALRHVAGGQRGPVLCTFTGGSGGAAKTALAASRVAAETLLETESLVHGGRE